MNVLYMIACQENLTSYRSFLSRQSSIEIDAHFGLDPYLIGIASSKHPVQVRWRLSVVMKNFD